jgi:hypothetical protein
MSEIKNLGQLISHLATKAGVSKDDQNLINVLSNAELSKVNVHSDLINALDNNLLSIDVAKDNHPEISKVYKAQALNAFDKNLETAISDAGFTEDEVTELKGIKNTYGRFEKVVAMLKEKKAATPNKEDKSALQKQVDELIANMKKLEEGKDAEIARLKAQNAIDKVSYEVRDLLRGKKTIYDNLPAATRAASLSVLIENALKEKDAELVFDDKGAFTIQKKDGSAYLGANHSRYTPESFIDEILANNKVIAVNPQNPPKNPDTPPRVIDGDGEPKGNNQVANINRKNREAMAANEG